MGMGYAQCPVCDDKEADWYEVDVMGMCRHCACETMQQLQQQIESLQRQLGYRKQHITRLKELRNAKA